MTGLYLVILPLNIVLFAVIYLLFPACRKAFVLEDRFMENLTVLWGVIALVVSLFLILKMKSGQPRKLYILIPILSLMDVLDELGFGERFFHLEMPVVLGEKIDAFHDFITLFYHLVKETEAFWCKSLLLGGFFLVAAVLIYISRKYLRQIPHLFRTDAAYRFVFCSVAFLLLSGFLDFDIIYRQFAVFIEELLEMNAALALLFAAFAIVQNRQAFAQ